MGAHDAEAARRAQWVRVSRDQRQRFGVGQHVVGKQPAPPFQQPEPQPALLPQLAGGPDEHQPSVVPVATQPFA